MATDRRLGLTWGAVALAAVLLAPLATPLAPLLPGCLFRDLTGLPCPTCGSAHAALALARLDLPGTIAFNPLTTLGALVFLLGGAAAAAASVAGRPLPEPRLSGPAPRSAALLAVAANWAWLLLHPPPAWLRKAAPAQWGAGRVSARSVRGDPRGGD